MRCHLSSAPGQTGLSGKADKPPVYRIQPRGCQLVSPDLSHNTSHLQECVIHSFLTWDFPRLAVPVSSAPCWQGWITQTGNHYKSRCGSSGTSLARQAGDLCPSVSVSQVKTSPRVGIRSEIGSPAHCRPFRSPLSGACSPTYR